MEDEEISATLNLSQPETGRGTELSGNGSASGVEGVRCLECGAVFDKPAGVQSEDAIPGCPDCGYHGWLAASVPFRTADAPIRFVLGRLRPRPA